MKIKKVNELNLFDYTKDELNQYRNKNFQTEEIYKLFGEILEKKLHTEPKYIELFDSDDLESCINWYEAYLEETAGMDFLESKTIYKLTGTRRVIKYHNVVLYKFSKQILDIDTLVTTKKFNV